MTTFQRIARTAARRMFLDRQAAFWLAPLTERRARVIDVIDETSDTKTFTLQPGPRWRGHRAGQFIPVELELDGRRVRRCYSISSAPSAATKRRIAITVKRVPGGQISNWLHDHVGPGMSVVIGPALGAFVVPEPAPGPLLLISGGSGITPVMSIVRDLAARGVVGDVRFVHHAKRREDVAFLAELQALAAQHPGLTVDVVLDDVDGGFDEARLAARVPDFATRTTFLCGPAGLMARVERLWAEAGASTRLVVERFASPPAAVMAAGACTLLEELERAGERPPSGCRIGICHTCTRKKVRGTVENLVTGVISSAPDELIQLCVSVPRGDVELAP